MGRQQQYRNKSIKLSRKLQQIDDSKSSQTLYNVTLSSIFAEAMAGGRLETNGEESRRASS